MKDISEYIAEEKQTVEGFLPGCATENYDLWKSAMTFVIRSYDGRSLPDGPVRVLAALADGIHGGKVHVLVKRGMYGNVAETVISGPTDLADALTDAFQHSYPATGINRGAEVMSRCAAEMMATEVIGA